jgi:hypothetical protein
LTWSFILFEFSHDRAKANIGSATAIFQATKIFFLQSDLAPGGCAMLPSASSLLYKGSIFILAVVAFLFWVFAAAAAQGGPGPSIREAEETVLSHAGSPDATMVSDGRGNFYGAIAGETYPYGAIFELSRNPAGNWTTSILYNFTGGADGSYPDAPLVMDSAGNLYGTASGGGEEDPNTYCGAWPQYFLGCGVVFELSSSNGIWTEKTLYTFQGVTDGMTPEAALTLRDGRIYGTTVEGGDGNSESCCAFGGGTVFELVPNSSGAWTEHVIYRFPATFDGSGNQPGYPKSNLIVDTDGNLYGTAAIGSTDPNLESCCGLVYELSPSRTGWSFSALYNFTNADGNYPMGNLAVDADGNLFGTTTDGGPEGVGVAFEVSPGPQGFTETLLHDFGIGTDGSLPYSGLTRDSRGNLYGTTVYGGGLGICGNPGFNLNYCGTVFALVENANSGSWNEIILYRFDGKAGGSNPGIGVTIDGIGRLIGGAASGKSTGAGVIFELSP